MELISNVHVYGMDESIRASKYPMSTDLSAVNDEATSGVLSRGRAAAGTGHDVFLNGIVVQFDLTFSKQAWGEMERYHFIDFVSSTSMMHRIAKFDIAEQCNGYVDPRIIDIVRELQEDVNGLEAMANAEYRKRAYLRLIYSTPVGFRLTARMTTNYRQLKTIYQQRKDHRLPEWREFCEWVLTLPRFTELTGLR